MASLRLRPNNFHFVIKGLRIKKMSNNNQFTEVLNENIIGAIQNKHF